MAALGTTRSALGCDDSRVGEVDDRNQGRARVMNHNAGRVRIYGEEGAGKLQGAEILGPG